MNGTALRTIDLESLSDIDLVGCVRRGERLAFGVIIQRHNRRLYRVARGVVKDDVEAEDVVQETYVRAFSSLDRFRGEASLATWLTRIALNEALDRLRKRKPLTDIAALEENSHEATIVPLYPDSAADPERSSARAEIRRLVEHAVDDLPDTFRPVFVMRDIEGLSVEETAELLGIRPETVKTRLHRARRLLRGALSESLATALTGSFPFAGERCAAMAETVMRRLGR